MLDKRIENINVFSEDRLITPEQLKRRYALTERAIQTVMLGQNTIKEILNRKDHRMFVVVGPCSIHDVEVAVEYAGRLKKLADEVADSLFLVMRVYFEKPRTRVGWQGLINDPDLDNSGNIEKGLHLARKLLLDIAELGLPVATEALDLVSPQYVQDLISWTAIGARTAESQTHRKMASGFTSVVGFKNSTNGGLTVAMNAMCSAANSNSFLSVNPGGKVAVVRTKGNPNTHIVLRGGGGRTNYDSDSIAMCQLKLKEAGLREEIMVDCSHANSQSDPARQLDVLENIIGQITQGNESIVSVMMESNLEWGKQPIPTDLKKLRWGVSVTDACIDWPATERALRKLRTAVKEILPGRKSLKAA
ncbi:MAG: 3-deoxy-7-phosphoheptulonate synthase [bacterium]